MELSPLFGKILIGCGVGALLMVFGKGLSILGAWTETKNYIDVYCEEIGESVFLIGAFLFFFSLALMIIWTGATIAY